MSRLVRWKSIFDLSRGELRELVAEKEREITSLKADCRAMNNMAQAAITRSDELLMALREVLEGYFGWAYSGSGEIIQCPNGLAKDRYEALRSLAWPK